MKTEKEKLSDKLKAEFDFDQYGRFIFIKKIIDFNRKKDQKFKVLDVGGRGNLLKKFLPKDDVFYLEPNLESSDTNLIKGDGCNIPLEDSSFDWVTSTDVLEHIPEKQRERFINENFRVSRLGTFIVAPFFSTETSKAEATVNDLFKKLYNSPHPWLVEHIENSLPPEESVDIFIKKNKLDYQVINNNELVQWVFLLGINLIIDKYSLQGKKIRANFNKIFNSSFLPGDSGDNSYRKIFLLIKDPEIKKISTSNKANSTNDKIEITSLALEMIVTVFNEINNLKLEKNQQLETRLEETRKMLQIEKEKSRKKTRILRNIQKSLRWRIPNFFYKIFKKIFH